MCQGAQERRCGDGLRADRGASGYVILGNGIVPQGADNIANRGRPTRDVAAEFLSHKLWVDFADQNPPVAVIAGRELFISLYRVYWGRRGLAVPARSSANARAIIGRRRFMPAHRGGVRARQRPSRALPLSLLSG